MYPGPDVLQELGRITIAGSLLDIRMGYLWHHLDRTVPEEKARKSLGSMQCEKVKKLAQERLIGPMKAQVLAAVEAAEAARFRRNEVVHQGWLLRGPDATHPWGDIFSIPLEQQAAYIEDWEREAKPSEDWLQVPRDSVEVVPAQALDELRQVERALVAATSLVEVLTRLVASSRGTGSPRGYIGPRDHRDGDGTAQG